MRAQLTLGQDRKVMAQGSGMRLTRLLEELFASYGVVGDSGKHATELEGVSLLWARRTQPRALVMQPPGLLLLAQGQLRCFVQREQIDYGAQTYAIVALPMLMETQLFATQEQPLLGLLIDIELTALTRMVELIGSDLPKEPELLTSSLPRGLSPVALHEPLQDAAARLTSYLCDKLFSRALAAGAVDEIIFQVLMGPHGCALLDMLEANSHHARIARVLHLIHDQLNASMTVEELAREARMSQSTFHRVFKSSTGQSPLRYIKQVRLTQARRLLRSKELSVSEVASTVGYDSLSQFSREFKRAFGAPPSKFHKD